MSIRFILRRLKEFVDLKKSPEEKPLLGEMIFDQENRKLLIGNPESENGVSEVATVVTGPHDRLYAEVENQSSLIPIGIVVRN